MGVRTNRDYVADLYMLCVSTDLTDLFPTTHRRPSSASYKRKSRGLVVLSVNGFPQGDVFW